MNWILNLIFCLIILSGCSTVKTPETYYRERLREDSIDWGFKEKNNLLDSQDGSVYYNRNVKIVGGEY